MPFAGFGAVGDGFFFALNGGLLLGAEGLLGLTGLSDVEPHVAGLEVLKEGFVCADACGEEMTGVDFFAF